MRIATVLTVAIICAEVSNVFAYKWRIIRLKRIKYYVNEYETVLISRLSTDRRGQTRGRIIKCCGIKRCQPDAFRDRMEDVTPKPSQTLKNTTQDFRPAKTKRILFPATTSIGPVEPSTQQQIVEIITPLDVEPSQLPPSTAEVLPASQVSSLIAADQEATSQTLKISSKALSLTPSSTAINIESTSPTTLITNVTITSTTTSTTDSTSTTSTSTSTTSTSTTSTSTSTTSSKSTSTTAKPKLCVAPSCDSFKQGIALSAPGKMPAGSFTMKGNIMMFASTEIVSLADASKGCSTLNMTLLTVLNLNTIQSYQPLLKKLQRMQYWTSASSEGPHCGLERTFAWCTTGTIVEEKYVNDTQLWTSNPIGSETEGNCVALGLIKNESLNLLSLSACADVKPYLCQPNCESGTCPKNCSKNTALFLNGALLSPKRFGKWVDVCGGRYLFGNEIASWEQNVQKCCSLDMMPIIFSSAEEQSCLSNYTKTNWTGNWNYWTGGLQGCRGLWGWCDGSNYIPMTDNLTWAPNQPEPVKDENCLHMRIYKNASSTALSDRNCSNKYIYACKSRAASSETLKDICPAESKKDATLFLSNNTVKDPFKKGDWYTMKGRYLFMPNFAATWSDAWKHCGLFDMALIAIKTTMKHATLSKFLKRFSAVVDIEYWTSATDEGFDDNYVWCNGKSDVDLAQVNWKSGQPKSADGNCVTVTFSAQSANLTTFSLGDCAQQKKFICEKPWNLSQADMMQTECMDLYGVTDDDLLQLKNNKLTVFNSTVKIKCFIKCIGEANGLLLFGKLNLPIEALRVIEESSTSDDDLQKNMGYVDECGNPASTDECTRAMEIYDCGKKKVPSVTNAIVTQLTSDKAALPLGAGAVYPNDQTYRRFCRAENLPCDVNPTLQQQLNSSGKTAMGSWFKFPTSNRKFFKSNQQAINTITPQMAYEYCCSLGLSLAEFANNSDLQLLNEKTGSAAFYYIGETTIDGQGKSTWCKSKKSLTPTTITSAGDTTTSSAMCITAWTNQYFADFYMFEDMCMPTRLNYRNTMLFLCE